MIQTAVLGGGCFWCLDAIYRQLPGVSSVTSGFAGGTTPHPTYDQVCSGTTGHAEVIRIDFDPSKISYQQILELFWQAHDPTTYHRQGPDIGSQYRSIVLYQDQEQRRIDESSKAEAQRHFLNPIVTEIVPFKGFYAADEIHQRYYEKNPSLPYSRSVIEPKLQKLQQEGPFQRKHG